MDDRDGWESDGGDGGAAVERAFREVADALRQQQADTAARIAALDRSMAEAVAALAGLVRTEYAGELAELGKTVRSLDWRLDGIRRDAGEQRDAIAGLHGAAGRALRRAFLYGMATTLGAGAVGFFLGWALSG